MSSTKLRVLLVFFVIASFLGYIVSCTHDDEILSSQGPDIVRGTDKVAIAPAGTATFDKAHSNVQWSSAYLGSASLLTGRFDNFGFDIFEFDEPNAAGIKFKAWVWLNSVNTSEPGRDDGCLLQTFGTSSSLTTDPANLAVITSKSVELSTTDKGYNVKADLTFLGVTKEITGKMNYISKTPSGTINVYGFDFQFQFLAKTDFGLVSTNVGDKADVKCNAIFRGP